MARVLKNIVFIALGFAAGWLIFDRFDGVQNPGESPSVNSEDIPSGSVEPITLRPAANAPLPIEAAAVVDSGTVRSEAGTNLLARLGIVISAEDIKAAEGLAERRSRGEYILAFEGRVERRFREAAINDLAKRMSSNSAPALLTALGDLGLDAESSEQLVVHQQKIQQASLQLEMALEQLVEARLAYDKRTRALLNEEDYARYRDFEFARPGSREYSKLEQFGQEKGYELDPALKEPFTTLIRESEAYTDKSSHGPYDAYPDIAIGDEMVAQKVQDDIQRISEGMHRLQVQAEAMAVPSPQLDLLLSYYSDAISKKQVFLRKVQESLAN